MTEQKRFKKHPNKIFIQQNALSRSPRRTSTRGLGGSSPLIGPPNNNIELGDWIQYAVTNGIIDIIDPGSTISSDPGNAIIDQNGLYTPEEDLAGIHPVSVSGNNTTAKEGNFTLPYADPWAARTAASAGDIIYIMAGTYTLTDALYDSDVNNGNLASKNVTYYLAPGAILIDNTSTTKDAALFDALANDTAVKVVGYGTIQKNNVDGADLSIFRATTSHTGVTFDIDVDSVIANGRVAEILYCDTFNFRASYVFVSDYDGFQFNRGRDSVYTIDIDYAVDQPQDTADSTWQFIRFGHTSTDLYADNSHLSVNINYLKSNSSQGNGVLGIGDLTNGSSATFNINRFDIGLPSNAVIGEMTTDWEVDGIVITPAGGAPDVMNSQYLLGIRDMADSTVTLNCGSGYSTNRLFILDGPITSGSRINLNFGESTCVSQAIFIDNSSASFNASSMHVRGNITSTNEVFAIEAGSTYTSGAIYATGMFRSGGAIARVEVSDAIIFLNSSLISGGASSLDADATGPFDITCLNTFANVDSSAKITDTTLTVNADLV